MEFKQSLYGDLLFFLGNFLSHKSKINIINLNRQIRRICLHNYMKMILPFVDWKDYIKMPSCIQKYIFKVRWVRNDYKYKIVEHVKHLSFSCDCFGPLLYHLPPNLISLRLGTHFSPDPDNLPMNLIFLDLYNIFNKKIDHLPQTLIYLQMSVSFNHPIDNLPISLKYLSFPNDSVFDQKINHLPPNLIYLRLGCKFSKKLNHLPSSLRTLVLLKNYRYNNKRFKTNRDYYNYCERVLIKKIRNWVSFCLPYHYEYYEYSEGDDIPTDEDVDFTL